MAIIESDAHYRDILRRIAALEALVAGVRAIQAEAIAERALGRLTDEDVRDVGDEGPLGDAVANLTYTLKNLSSDAADWEAFADYGARTVAGVAGGGA
ncbi:MAG: hypothetical protein HKN28_00710 [Alphaproteobacteria bacterium]|nr:hypothetical protein [Alphaproteobacteria bacterium]